MQNIIIQNYNNAVITPDNRLGSFLFKQNYSRLWQQGGTYHV